MLFRSLVKQQCYFVIFNKRRVLLSFVGLNIAMFFFIILFQNHRFVGHCNNRHSFRYLQLTRPSLVRTVESRPKNRGFFSYFLPTSQRPSVIFNKHNTTVPNLEKIKLFPISCKVHSYEQLFGTFTRSPDISVQLRVSTVST